MDREKANLEKCNLAYTIYDIMYCTSKGAEFRFPAKTIMTLWTRNMSRSLREGPRGTRSVPFGILGILVFFDFVVFEGLDVQQVRAKRLLCREYDVGQRWAPADAVVNYSSSVFML